MTAPFWGLFYSISAYFENKGGAHSREYSLNNFHQKGGTHPFKGAIYLAKELIRVKTV